MPKGRSLNLGFLLLAYLSLFAFSLNDNLRGPIFPDLLQEFSLSDTTGALFFSASSFCALVSAAVAPYWLKRVGAYRGLQISLILHALSGALIGAAKNYSVVLSGAAVFGLASSGLAVSQTILVSEGTKPEWRRQAFSGQHAMYGLASLLAPLLASLAFERGLHWNECFGFLVLPPLLLFCYSLRSGPTRSAATEARALASRVFRKKPWRPLIAMSLILGLYVMAEILLSSRLVLFARRDHLHSPESSNGLLSLFFLCLLAGRAAFAFLRFGQSHRFVMSASAVLSIVLFIFGIRVHPMFLSFCGLSMAPFYPAAMAWIADDFGEFAEFGIAMALAFISGGLVFMHAFAGLLTDHFGLARALMMGPVCLGLVLILLVFAKAFCLGNRLTRAEST